VKGYRSDFRARRKLPPVRVVYHPKFGPTWPWLLVVEGDDIVVAAIAEGVEAVECETI
jgi:hypothetical protein